jgi:hypothetical protein
MWLAIRHGYQVQVSSPTLSLVRKMAVCRGKIISSFECFGLESSMAMGTRKQGERQEPLWYQSELPEGAGASVLSVAEPGPG